MTDLRALRQRWGAHVHTSLRMGFSCEGGLQECKRWVSNIYTKTVAQAPKITWDPGLVSESPDGLGGDCPGQIQRHVSSERRLHVYCTMFVSTEEN